VKNRDNFAQVVGTHPIKPGQIPENRDVWSPYGRVNILTTYMTCNYFVSELGRVSDWLGFVLGGNYMDLGKFTSERNCCEVLCP